VVAIPITSASLLADGKPLRRPAQALRGWVQFH
jgi:hypothetical protein